MKVLWPMDDNDLHFLIFFMTTIWDLSSLLQCLQRFMIMKRLLVN